MESLRLRVPRSEAERVRVMIGKTGPMGCFTPEEMEECMPADGAAE